MFTHLRVLTWNIYVYAFVLARRSGRKRDTRLKTLLSVLLDCVMHISVCILAVKLCFSL